MPSGRSPLLKEGGHLSSALTDAEGRFIAQGRDIPIHMGVMGFTVKEFLKRVPPERLHVVLNRVSRENQLQIPDLEQVLGQPIAGAIPNETPLAAT